VLPGVGQAGLLQELHPAPHGRAVYPDVGRQEVVGEVVAGLACLPGGLRAKALPEVAAAQVGQEEEELHGAGREALVPVEGQEVFQGPPSFGVLLRGLGQSFFNQVPAPRNPVLELTYGRRRRRATIYWITDARNLLKPRITEVPP
jgi:hypothetical protein